MEIIYTQRIVNGVLRQWWDDATRTYHEYDESGAETLSRPYRTEENSAADARAVRATEDSNAVTITAALETSLATLQAIIDDTNANINTNPASRIKDLARVQRRIIRHVLSRFDGTD